MLIKYKRTPTGLEPLIQTSTTPGLKLGHYGQKICKYMDEYHNKRYWHLIGQGTLIEKIHERELYIEELKEKTVEQLMERNPRPNTTDTMELARYYEWIYQTSEELIQEELYQSV